MSGLVGYIGRQEAKPVILDSLERLEYRGYDSAGLGIISGGALKVFKTIGRPVNLAEKISSKELDGKIGIGHTRWATHGKVTIKNAHPLVVGSTAVVHNGILKNAARHRAELKKSGIKCKSDTDSEIIPHLINLNWKGNLLDSVLSAVKELEGGATFCVISADDPDTLVAVRKGNPLVVGLGEGEQIVASDATALAPYTDRVVFLRDGEIAVLSHEGVQLIDFDGNDLENLPQKISWGAISSEKRGYRHFLLKEIVESPRAVRETVAKSLPISAEHITPDDFSFPDVGKPERVIYFGSGSSYYAANIGQMLCESIAGVSNTSKVASEYRYGMGMVEKDALYVAISQSGESLDTIESARIVVKAGAKLMSITNNESSSLARLAHYPLITQAGPEVSVVSSKTFSATMMALVLLAFHLGKENGNLSVDDQQKLIDDIRSIPEKMEITIAEETLLRRLAEKCFTHRSFFYVGRGLLYPVALYSALLMKEVANGHGEGLLAGEIKHGSISLIEKGSPIMFFANHGFMIGQLLEDMDELKARGAELIAIGREGIVEVAEHCDNLITVPSTDGRLSPMLAIAPAQLFIYYLGLYNRKDVDRPRNIAKSVTV